MLQLAEERLGLQAIEGDIFIDDLDQFAEAGACGTAAVISPIGGIYHNNNLHVFYSETEVGPVTKNQEETLKSFFLIFICFTLKNATKVYERWTPLST